MTKEYETTMTEEIEIEEGEAATPEESESAVLNGGVVTVKDREFYCTLLDGKEQMQCVSVKGEKVQLRPPKDGYFYSEAIKQLTNGSEG